MQLWVYALICIAGLLAGGVFKAAFMIATSIVITVVLALMVALDGSPDLMSAVGFVAAGPVSFQAGYLAGLLIASAWQRMRYKSAPH